MEDDQAGDEISYSVFPLVTPGGIALSDTEKAEALADSLETVSARDRSFGPGSY